ncbi:MAG TPA: class I SAM-dependent methyltransferase, partial [Bacteroidales bacterium]
EKAAILKHLQNIPVKSTFLEVGCGTGHWTKAFANLGFSVTALDISDAMLDIALAKNISHATFIKGDAMNLPFHDNSYDVVVSVTMLEFTQNAKNAIDEMFRVLKKNGLLILGCLNSESVLGKTKDNDPIFKHARFFSKKDLVELLKKFSNTFIEDCVMLTDSFELVPDTIVNKDIHGVFIVVKATK